MGEITSPAQLYQEAAMADHMIAYFFKHHDKSADVSCKANPCINVLK